MRRALLPVALLFVAALAACQAPSGSDQPQKSPLEPVAEDFSKTAPNLLSMVNGATVVSRTGEMSLSASAIHAIDADLRSRWSTPPGDLEQTMIVSLPTRTRIEQIGASNQWLGQLARAVSRVEFQTSIDGSRFRPLKTVDLDKHQNFQRFSVFPRDASFVQIRLLDNVGASESIDAPSLEVYGRELNEFVPPTVAGEWTINQYSAHFIDDGARVLGSVDMDPPLILDGAWSGRSVRFSWIRNRQYGLGIMTLSRDGKSMNVLRWFEEAIPMFSAEAWFGKRIQDTPNAVDPYAVTSAWISRFGRLPLYQISSDSEGKIDVARSGAGLNLLLQILSQRGDRPVRLVAQEFRHPTPQANLRATERLSEELKRLVEERGGSLAGVHFVAAGNEKPKYEPKSWMQAHMYSRILLESGRPPSR